MSLKVKSSLKKKIRARFESYGFNNQQMFAERVGCTRGVISKFLNGHPISRIYFQDICRLLSEEWQDIAEMPVEPAEPRKELTNAPVLSVFYGRKREVAQLKEKLLDSQTRLLGIFGIGGVGKTTLARKLVDAVIQEFDYVMWVDLREPKMLNDTLLNIVKFLSENQENDISKDLQESIRTLIQYLTNKRCLIILDNLESLLVANNSTGQLKVDYEEYTNLLDRICQPCHKSCFVITSRERPSIMDVPIQTVYFVRLQGLDKDSARDLIKSNYKDSETNNLIDLYEGHPLALKLAIQFIRESNISIHQFIVEVQRTGKVVLFDRLNQVLDWHFNRLSIASKEVLYWLAVNREPVSCDTLADDIISKYKRLVFETIDQLHKRSLIENTENEGCFTLQNVIMEYLTCRLVNTVIDEFTTGKCDLLHSFALIKATSKDFVRDNQIKLILKPIIDALESPLIQILKILSIVRSCPNAQSGYAAGNLLNLLCYLSKDSDRTISNLDFSGLTILQADLQNYNLHVVNFSHAFLKKCLFTKTLGSILALSLSPDGRLLATGDGSGDVCLWDLETHQKHFTGTGHTNWVTGVIFTPDGRKVLSSSEDCTLRLWDAETGQCLRIYRGHDNWILAVTLSPDGHTIATGSSDRTIRLWNLETGECLKTLTGHDRWVSSVKYTADGQFLLSSSYDGSIRLWDSATGDCLRVFCGHTLPVLALALSPDTRTFASSGDDTTIQFWNLKHERAVATLNDAHHDGIGAIVYSPNGEFLASSAADGKVKVWDASTNHCLHILDGHTNWLKSVAFSPDSKALVSGSGSQGLKVWDTKTGECLQTFAGKVNWLRSVDFSPDTATLVSGGVDEKVRIWDIKTGLCLKTLKGHSDALKSVIYSPNGLRIASSGDDYMVRIWDAQTYRCCLILRGHTNRVLSAVFSPDGETLASGSEDNTLKLWKIQTGECIATLTGHDHWIQSVRFSPDGKELVSGSSDFSIAIWDISKPHHIKMIREHTAMVRCVLYTPDGQQLISCSDDCTIRVWDRTSGECVRVLVGHSNWIWEIALSPCGKTLVSGSEDNSVRLWDLATGSSLWVGEDHTNWVRSVAFSADGRLIASGSEDETIKIWEVKTGACLKTLRVRKPYEDLDITGVQGLTEATRDSLKALGAIERLDTLIKERI
jgi:WD40 repeat protein